jgi:hypothetical protein
MTKPSQVATSLLFMLLTGGCAGSKVTSIQRVNTAGGVAPGSGCSQAAAGTPTRVPYTADYYFFTSNKRNLKESS